MVIHDKFIFAHLVKTGGSFTERWLRSSIPSAGTTGQGHKKHRALGSLSFKERAWKYKFGIVRNPFAWYVSWWTFNGVRRSPGNSFPGIVTSDFKETLDNLFKATGTYQVGTLKKKIPMYVDFDLMRDLDIGILTLKFIQTFCKEVPYLAQLEAEEILKTYLLLDKVLRTEQLRSDLEHMFDKHIFPLTEEQRTALYSNPRQNVTVKEDYRTFYTAPLIARIAWKERYLIDMFNYDFENGDIHDN